MVTVFSFESFAFSFPLPLVFGEGLVFLLAGESFDWTGEGFALESGEALAFALAFEFFCGVSASGWDAMQSMHLFNTGEYIKGNVKIASRVATLCASNISQMLSPPVH